MKPIAILLACLCLGGCLIVPESDGGGKAGGGTELICHKGKKTLELPHEAVQAHLGHGDRRGPC